MFAPSRAPVLRIRHVLLVVAILCEWWCPHLALAQEYGVAFLAHATPPTLAAAERSSIPLTLRNTGTVTSTRADQFLLGYYWSDSAGNVVQFDGERTGLPRDVQPGETVQLCATLVAPAVAGAYVLKWDMVQEQRTWFSARSPGNAITVGVNVGSETPATVDTTTFLATALFWLITIGPLPLTAYWLYVWWGQDIGNWDEYLFHVVVFGLGHVYAVLQLLVFSIGLSVTAVGLALVAIHMSVAAATFRRERLRRAAPEAPSVPRLAAPFSLPDVLGISLMVALLMQWAWASSHGSEILGTDAANYHVPHAVNFLRGVNPTSFLATSHLYPMGTSVWAAWFFEPFDGPLLLELATTPAFALLFAASCVIFRLLTARSGLAWVPWLTLFAFTAPLSRVSLLMSADLSYAAGFVAVAAALLLIWRTAALDARQTLALALCSGWLAGAKSTGLFSLACFFPIVVLIVALLARRRCRLDGLRPAALAAAAALFVASGGLWLLRNWWMFGSPLAPYGLSVFGVQIFDGPPASDARYYLSVLGDMRDRPNYAPWTRFLDAARVMFGGWSVWAAGLAVLLPVDLALQHRRRHQVSPEGRIKLIFTGLLLVTFAVHVVVIAGLPWTSLEWTRSSSIRYLLPFFYLYVLTLYGLVFTDGVVWDRPTVRGSMVAAIVAALSVWYYQSHDSVPGLPEQGWIAVLTPGALAAAAALTIPVYFAFHGHSRRVSALVAAGVAVFGLGALSWHGASDRSRAVQAAASLSRQESSCAEAGTQPTSEHRGLYLRVLAFQQSRGLSCVPTRFFLASRFDQPLALEDAGYRNLLLDVRVSSTRSLEQQGPGPTACDVVIAARADVEAGGPDWLNGRLKTRAALARVAGYGRFEAYVRK